MSRVIAGLYNLGEEIGAGGGGVVYLGQHLRLKKPVVLKADKGTLSTDREDLEREMKLLRNLSHTFIPQLYDFVEEDGKVYTVMDYIEGESLDKLLGRRQIPDQPKVIKWACQLLEALCYLHSQPPHGILHGDIKPANIMLRPNGDICLIDFNIALALGEEGAVKAGYSKGYASPEHYGADGVQSNGRDAGHGGSDETVKQDRAETQTGHGGSGETVKQDRADTQTGHGGSGETVKQDRAETQTGHGGTDETVKQDVAEVYAGRRSSDETVNQDGAAAQAQSGGTGTKTSASGHSGTGRKGGVLLDVRSDIYCLGATLYHLLSGVRPAERAVDVAPLGPEVCSPAVSAILQKAMAPEPEKRYQTAEEMRRAFLNLHRTDRRAVRHRRRMAVCAGVLAGTFLLGGGTAFAGQRQLGQIQEAYALAGYSADALAKGDVSGAVRLALQAVSQGDGVLDAPVTAQAQKALADALGVYDLSDGFRALDTVELPSAPFDIAVSPGGTRFAAVYAYEAAVYDLETQERIAVLEMQESALADVVFLDENRVVYAGSQGAALYDLDRRETLWTGEAATKLSVSGDGRFVAAVDRGAQSAVVYRVSDGEKAAECSFGDLHMPVAVNDIFADPGNAVFALNGDGSMLAVSFSNGGLVVFDLADPKEDLILYEESDYIRFGGGFCGRYFAFTAAKGGEALFGLVDTREAAYVGGYASQDDILLQADERGIYVADGNLLVELDVDTLEERELAYVGDGRIRAFSAGDGYSLAVEEGGFAFYDSGANLSMEEKGGEAYDFAALAGKYAVLGSRNGPYLRLLALEGHEEAQLLAYDARYVHDEARVSGDGKTVMLFGYQGFRIYDRDGGVVAEAQMPGKESIYDQQFVKGEDGSWLEVVWYDGTVRRYSAEDGSLLSEEAGEAPAKDLYEEFYTGRYRVESPLHGAPRVYDAESGRLAAVLEEDSYLTYVTQFGEYLVTEYISADGERYGLLLDERFEKLAYLPGLCDVWGDMLVFDYKSGDLRQCRLYSLRELTALGETYVTGDQGSE